MFVNRDDDKVSVTKVTNNICKCYSKTHEYVAEMYFRYFAHRLAAYGRILRSAKVLFLAFCVICTCSFLFLQQAMRHEAHETENLVQEALQNVARDLRYTNVYRKPSTLPEGYKYILLWTRKDFAPFYYFGVGQRAFLSNKCSVTNCYVTANRGLLGGDITKFDAIAFNARNLRKSDLPKVRSMKQKYIYVTSESADNYPLCDWRYDNFFNWTATYKLDSDIPMTYFVIKDKKGRIVGPKRQMKWMNPPKVKDELDRVRNKSKAGAWFVSHCNTRSNRKQFVQKLQKALKWYGHKIDVYGSCGTMDCPRNNKSNCDSLLEREYFFYMSLENSFCPDYVTEKLLTSLQTDVVPVVYGGADYSRFLPPGSYINGRNYTATQLAAKMVEIMRSPRLYNDFFWWKKYYTYQSAEGTLNVCALCEALNNKQKVQEYSAYPNLRQWWHPSFLKRCHIKS